MLSQYESRMSAVRLMRATQCDHVEYCNSIHCDMIAGIISKCDRLEENGSGKKAIFVESIRSFIAERPSRRLALVECLSTSKVQQILTERWLTYEKEVSKSVIDRREEYWRLISDESDNLLFPGITRGAAVLPSWKAYHHHTPSKLPLAY